MTTRDELRVEYERAIGEYEAADSEFKRQLPQVRTSVPLPLMQAETEEDRERYMAAEGKAQGGIDSIGSNTKALLVLGTVEKRPPRSAGPRCNGGIVGASGGVPPPLGCPLRRGHVEGPLVGGLAQRTAPRPGGFDPCARPW